MQLPEACIETTSYREQSRTLWVVKLRGEILKVGEVSGDPSGTAAYEAAMDWAGENVGDVEFAWKHWQGAQHAAD